MSNLTEIKNFLQQSHCDLGENAWVLLNLVKEMKDARFMDLGVRTGASSAIMSVEAADRNNQVCGCDVNFEHFESQGAKFVNSNYMCYLADSVTLGKNWNEDSFDIIFVDTIHTREQVLAELYFWIDHLKEGGYLVFHDTHWEGPGDIIGGKQWERVDVAVTDFFVLPNSVREIDKYEDDDIILEHYKPSYGMTIVKVKNRDSIKKFKNNIDWKNVFEIRNWLNNLHFNKNNPNFVDWNLDLEKIENELEINL